MACLLDDGNDDGNGDGDDDDDDGTGDNRVRLDCGDLKYKEKKYF
mgnify:CR=1 FL=1